MYPSKSMTDYMSEINRLFSNNGENGKLAISLFLSNQHYQSEMSTTPLASISQWHNEYNLPILSQKRNCQKLPDNAQQLLDREYPITKQNWYGESTENLRQWSDFNSPVTTQRWKEHGSPTRHQRPIIGRRLMTNDKQPEPIKFDPAIWRSETPPKLNNFYVEQRNINNAKYELFPENAGFDVRSVQSNMSSVSPISNVSPITNIGYTEKSIVPKFSTPLISTSLPISGEKLCTFCRKNGETPSVYLTHNVKERVKNKHIVTCPILRSHVCSACGVSGDMAHTITYCPVLRSTNNGQPLPSTTITLKNTRIQSNGKRRY
ncbi:hypothetical protein K1T71_013999 [Dendrolimus kikuchii]|uniref:Uncharacterized protein n=1 Tax=Dendrolimus kikuchii TaxID=765133 RepID=A0ACC1CGB9_9NEOP|nr:hypothetical protein K1T71_013999 [Dendrolimus kikuchii]